MLIDCDRCSARPAACSDCVVGVLLGTPEVPTGPGPVPSDGPAEPAERSRGTLTPPCAPPSRSAPSAPLGPGAPLPDGFGPVEHRALEVLADHGLIPRLRLVPGSPGDDADRSAPAPVRRSAPRRARDAG